MISRALLNAPFFIPKDADLLRNRKVNTKKRQNRHLPELAFLILGTYFTAPALLYSPVESIVRPAELHSRSAEENCSTKNVSSLRPVKVATPTCAACASIPCGLAVRKRF